MAAALEGIKVLDLSRVLAGPWATMTLGDLGAQIWKVEHPSSGDDTRSWSPPSVDGISTYYLAANRNKRSIAVDISSQDGRKIVTELIAQADILVENFKASSLRKLNLTFEETRKINPRLIHCSISGYGRDNPLEDRPGYDFILQAECGFMAITGDPAGEPMRLGVAFIDLVSGMNAVQAILAALYVRERTGKGQFIDIGLSDSALFFLANIASGYLNTGKDPKRFGNAHPSIVPYQLFHCVDGIFALAVGNDEQYRRLCMNVLSDASLVEDDRYRTNQARTVHRDELISKLQAAFASLSLEDLMRKLRQNSIPAGEVKTVSEAFSSEHAQSRKVVVEATHPTLGTVRTVRSPLRLSGTPPVDPTAPPLLGEHTDSILREVLSYSEADIASLRAAGVIA
ncbi:crotonobetainyl-CoA:carnitine CoA-transferase CaiB-like acyl-CoA transferase [Microvirga flocculans]|uniref:Crotonobetainyl-CoA:carnitine CoA-transferase CaiB-like acyl-CoA transferase n=1 Tax=Microvirga flocculans TaxID=217168 RepID=A0A7W6N8A1_9HYPH|nr:CaiB/BaiF CoA-transferase family protein [Microvirga flocculans]MBB4040472.1 crotonobetainyl-CoA:carnitine CoA-transferase CaiB-like acyl-CoA transferase [Microvirga flocculans]